MPTTGTASHPDLLLNGTTLALADGTALYARLRRDVIAAGILKRDHGYYWALIIIVAAGLTGSLIQIVLSPVSLVLVLWSVSLAFFAVQTTGLVHDAGHRAVFGSNRLNDVLGECCSALLGMGFGLWKTVHNAHHAHTNEEGEDPDLEIPLHAFTRGRFARQRGVWRYVGRYQALLFYPIRILVVFTRRLASIPTFRERPLSPRLAAEMTLWAAGMAVWFGLPFVVFPLAKALLVSGVVHTTMGLYLSNIFAPNHKGMPQLRQGADISFLERQIITSRNIRPSWATDVVYMGLNYQIEHHLFPTCPRNKLKHLTPYVQDICIKAHLTYTEVSIRESHRLILAELHRIARSAE